MKYEIKEEPEFIPIKIEIILETKEEFLEFTSAMADTGNWSNSFYNKLADIREGL